MADEKPKYHSDTWLENNDVTTNAKQVKLWGYDVDNLAYVKVAVDSSGNLKSVDLLREYQMSDQDNSEPTYIGYLRADGAWYIIKQTTSGNDITYRYVKGSTGYNWANRASETYNTFDVEF